MKPLLFIIAFRPKRSKQIKWFGLVVKRESWRNTDIIVTSHDVIYISTDGLISHMTHKRCLFDSKQELKKIATNLIGQFHIEPACIQLLSNSIAIFTQRTSKHSILRLFYLGQDLQKLNQYSWHYPCYIHNDTIKAKIRRVRQRYPYIKILY